MNRPIRRVAFVAILMFALLLANGTYLIVFQQESLASSPQNRRVRDAQFAQDRGSILAAGKTEIARTEPVKDRFGYQRSYPEDDLYAAVTGFFSYDRGSSGLEATYDRQLAGTDDALFVRRLIDRLTNRAPQGASVQTTIVPELQRAAVRALGRQKGAVVALDPRTGAVLALVSGPGFNPNTIASHDIRAAGKAYARLAENERQPLANRAVREVYPPGSTFKLVTAAAALEAGQKPDTRVEAPDKLRLPGTTTDLGNSQDCGAKKVTLTHALEISCNTAFANIGLSLGDDRLREQADKFGFDTRHLPDLSGAASRFPESLDDAQLALSSIGQFDVAASPLQMAMVSAAIANDGVLMDPYIVSQVQAPDLKPIETHRPEVLSRPMSPENARLLQQMMVSVVTNGTAGRAAIPGVEVGGKTGTAQSDPKRKPFAWFTAFAPAKDPEVAVAVVIEDADVPRTEIAGSRLAAPIARATMEAAL